MDNELFSTNGIPGPSNLDRENLRANPSDKPKKIRGVSEKKYAELMHKVERGDISEATLVRRKILLPGKGIAAKRDDQIFNSKSKIKGRKNSKLCTVPSCNNEPSRRGQCNTHRVYCRRMLRLGKANETNLINRGLLLPKQGIPIKPVKNVIKRFSKGQPTLLNAKHCLFPSCNQARSKQGLCKKHYRIYLRKASKLSDRSKKLLEQDLIKRKLLLPKDASDENAFELGSKIRGKIHRA